MKNFNIFSKARWLLVPLVLFTLNIGQMWATTGTLTLSSSNKFGTSSGSTKNDNQGNTWTCTCSNIQNSYQTTYSGQQFGTGSSPADATFTCTIAGATISSVKATMATGAGGTYTIKVGGVTKYSGSLTTTATEYGGTDATGTGEIEIKITKGTKASYLGQIVVVYTTAPAVAHTVTYNAGTGSCKASEAEASAGAGVTLPTPTHSCYSEGWSFAGWTTGALITTETDEAPATLYSGGSNYKPAADITLYAVYKKGDGKYHLVTTLPTGDDIPGNYMVVNTSAAKAMDAYVVSSYYLDADATGTITSNAITPANVSYFSYNHWKVTYESSKWIFYNESQSKYLYNYASNGYHDLGIKATKPTGYTLSLSSGYAVFTSADDAGAHIYYDSSNSRFAATTSSTNNLHLYKEDPLTYYSNPSCCTELGTINGSISLTNAECSAGQLKATWKMSATTGIASQVLHVYDADNDDEITASKITGISPSTSNQTQTISDLTPCHEYYVKVENISSGGSYCGDGFTGDPSSDVAAAGYSVTSTGVTNATASPAIPSTTCASGFSTTISAAAGYALPADITVTNASKTWNSSTGALTISSVTGNVSITITPTCVPPVVTGDPADANYYVGDDPTALSVTATLASGTRTYLWKVSTNGGSTWSDAAGTNNAATYSGASLSTASVGTLKFKCIVGNSEGGCTVESGVATITVNAASSWKLKGSWDSWEEHTMIEDAGVASYSISLDADSRFEFGFDGGSFYKNNGTIITTTNGWVFNTTDNNCHIHTGPAGTYTFAINTSTKAVTVTYPTVSHPNEHYVYFKNTNVWGTVYGYLANSGNDNKAAAWPGSVMQPTTTICGETYHYAALNAMSGTYNTIIFNNGNTGYGNQTSDLSTTGSLGKYNANQDASWHQFKYAINFDRGTGSGDAMASIENLCPGSNQALTANTYTKEHNTFAGWIADVDVKVGESTIDAGEIIDDEVTIKDIQSDINLTAQWTPNTYTITKTLTNVSNTGLPASFTYTGAATTALNSTFTVDATNFFLPSSITVTMGGTPLTVGTDYTYNNSTGAFTFSAVITGDIVITAAATAKLKSIAITTQPTTRKYFAGESFSSTGAVVTATMGDGSMKAVTASTTWTPPATPLAAGTSLTVTASYTENAINMTATTTIDVYSVTVNKVNEDGDAIDVAGVTATWTVGTKALAAGVGSTKYAFKQWDVTGATAASTSSASTTLSSPTANVVVNAVFWKPRTVKWSVNGNDSYNTGSPTTEVAYNGTISTVPTAPSGLVCASTFVAWTDAAHNNGTTAKPNTSYYESKLFTAANQFPNITAETTTFYAVFAEGTGAAVNTVMWSEDWTGATTSDGNSGMDDAKPSAQGAHSGKTVYGGGSVTYEETSNATYVRNENTGGGTAPELMIKSSQTFTISSIPSGGASELTLTYKRNNQALTPTVSGTGYSISYVSGTGKATYTYTITCGSGTTFNLVFTAGSSNVRLDDIEVKVKTVTYSGYVTECDANIVSVTYDANGGATSCTNTTTDKTEDFTVCSSAPTRDYYTFAGWLCSADSKTYAASATIPAAAIDADFTLTAQWTPVPYSITYNYNGGSAQVDPVPATSYTVESSDITLQTPTKGHDRFDGWYENADLSTGGVKTTIAAGSHENKTYYAKWTARHEIIFDADGVTTTIYRANDEDLSASVAGQGNVPSDPDAPTACSSKVFVGWSESTIDGETDTEPGDLMKPAAGTVNEDKHYYAVWATESSSSGPVTVFNDAFARVDNGTAYGDKGKISSSNVYGTGTAGEARISSSSNAGYIDIDLSDKTLASSITIAFKLKYWSDSESGTLMLGCEDEGSTASFSPSSVTYPTTSGWKDYSCTVTSVNAATQSVHFQSYSAKRIYIKDIVITQTGTIYSYSAYSTSCCATKIVLSDPSITDASSSGSTITFDKSSPVWTCGGTKTVTATLTLTAGYQASALSFAVNSGTVSISPAISTPVTSSQVYTLTFAEDQNATLTTTATIAAKPLNGITITPSSGEVYVGQYTDFTVSYDPADYINPGYTLNATPVYVTKESAAPANTKLRLKGGRGSGPGASITETVNETVTIKASGDNTKTASVEMTVKPLPRVHFVDLVHGKAFADVVATIAENALNPNKTTKTSVDWVTPNANPCEENHLHLVGWIREDWPALVAYLNGTGAAPTTVAITGAGNDGEGHAYYIAAGASINVQTFDGVTFYAVWSKVE